MVDIFDPICDVPGIVDYERPDTWPRTLTALFDAHAEILKNHGREEHRINMLSFEERLSVQNRCEDQHNHIVRRADEILASEQLLGFHCTRLADDEIADVWAHGLRLLSADFLQERIHCRIEAGDMPESLGLRLWKERRTGNDNHPGRIWFINMRSRLKLKGAVQWLFRSWGGEALSINHGDDPETGPLLCQIGTPCIWIAALPISQCGVRNMGERFVWAYLAHRGAATGNGPDLQISLLEPLPPDSIINVVRYDDPAFEMLTGCSTWRDPIMPSVEIEQGDH